MVRYRYFRGWSFFSSACRNYDSSFDRLFFSGFTTYCVASTVVTFYLRGRERPLLYHEACAKWLLDEYPTSSTSEVMYFVKITFYNAPLSLTKSSVRNIFLKSMQKDDFFYFLRKRFSSRVNVYHFKSKMQATLNIVNGLSLTGLGYSSPFQNLMPQTSGRQSLAPNA
jgi:hypothetical protein